MNQLRLMRRLRSVADLRAWIVADTSVAINLNATGVAAHILGVLPFRVAITDVVVAELQEDRRSGRRDAELVDELVKALHIEVVSLGAVGQGLFIDLVIGPAAETLDDGEATTIAYAAEHGIAPVIDERKARRICTQRFAQLRPMSTVDIFKEATVEAALGRQTLSDAVFQALQTARMRVLPHQLDWVAGLIGADRVSHCPSLPRAARRR
jgi:predicted nucleic acid-binding protein